MDSKLFCEVVEGEKTVTGIKAFLIFSVTAFYLAVVAWSVGPNQFVADAKFCSRCFKKCGKIPFAVGKTIGKFKAIVGLNTLHLDAPAGIPFDQFV